MYNSSFRTYSFVIVLLLLLLSPLAVYAAGLGKLTLNSALGQPLQAEIDIVSVNNDELSSLRVELASHDAFTQAGIRYESFFSTFNVSIEPRNTGEPYVIITSPQSINEPFLNILVELSWASGRLLREYTVLLDPIEYDRPAPVAPTVQIDDKASKINESAPTAVAPRSGTYGPVARGDTLSDIARQITPEGVNLNQMLVAMYRANRTAFIDNNMNLLRVGALLRIPESSEIMAIEVAEANAEIKTQMTDWHSYREKLVEVANEVQPSEVLSQADSGQITTSVDNDGGATFNGKPEEVLRLSSGDTQGEDSDTSMMDRLRMMEEDTIAHTLALQEANERVAMLKKQVEDLRQLLVLKQPDLAQAQYQVEVISEIDTKSESDALEIITSSPELISDEAFEFIPEQEANEYSDSAMDETIQDPIVVSDPIIEEITPEPVASPTPLPVEEEVSYMDLIMENIEYVIGALLVLLGILFFIKRRQTKSEEDVDMDFGDTSASIRNKMVPVAAAKTAYSMDSDSLSSESNKATKLENTAEKTEEVDFEKDTNFFPEEKDYDAQTNENMDLAVESPQETENELNDELISDHEIELDLSDASSSQDEDIKFEEVAQESEQVEPAVEIDLDLEESAINEEPNLEIDDTNNDKISVDDTHANEPLLELDLADINLDMENEQVTEEAKPDEARSEQPEFAENVSEIAEAPEATEKSEPWYEVETKMDLAKAYHEMDDKEGAREMFEEIMRDGDEQQQEKAKAFLKEL